MENKAIELHDSTLTSVHNEEDHLDVCFRSAYVHKSNGIPGVDAGTGWAQNIRFIFHSPIVDGEWPSFPIVIQSGELKTRKRIYKNIIPISSEKFHDVCLLLIFSPSNEVRVRARNVDVITEGNAVFLDSFPGCE